VRTPPTDLTEQDLAATLRRQWGIAATGIEYRPVGFGSHHWEVVDGDGTRWFVTVDDLATGPHAVDEPAEVAFTRLHASLRVARALRDAGRDMVVAPVSTVDDEPLARLGRRYAVAAYPFVEGDSFAWGDYAPGHREALLGLVLAVHSAPEHVRRHAMTDDFQVPHRDELEASLAAPDAFPDRGPHSRPTAALLAEHADPVRVLLARYDALVAGARTRPARSVLTHGEPHPGNTLRTAGGWRLIDWDTALLAPPERDLWLVDPGDGSMLRRYADATGVTPDQSMVDLYRLRWDLADLAVAVSRFRAPHTGTADDDTSWDVLVGLTRPR
jgi:spectinomycin phosphotransferase/16S rRNA (guanine(1405)-N(7))-methyltransferase